MKDNEHGEMVDSKWHEWSMRVIQEIVTLTSRTEQLSKDIDDNYHYMNTNIDEKLSHICKKIDTINQLMNGISDPSQGLVVRVDRLEQSESRRTWLLRASITSCIGAIVATIVSWLKTR